MISYITTFLAGITALVLLLHMLLRLTQDAREPPPVDTEVPFLSVLARIGWRGLSYWDKHA